MELLKVDQLVREAKPASNRKIKVEPVYGAVARTANAFGTSATVLHLSVWQHFISHDVISYKSLPKSKLAAMVQE